MTTPYPDRICRGPAGVFHREGSPADLVWQNPETGELRFCPAQELPRFTDPWADDTARIVAEIAAWCRCDSGFSGDCDGWSEDEISWFENHQPVAAGVSSRADVAGVAALGRRRRRWFGGGFRYRYRDHVNPRTAKVGDLDPLGSTATSVVERQIRAAIQEAGHYQLLPPSMRLWSRPDNGGLWYCTPDLIVCPPRGRVIAVEVDPLFTHSGVAASGEDVVERDRERNRMYARAGWKVVRIRLDGATALSPNDVVLPAGFNADRDTAAILDAVAAARFYRAGVMR
jgi:hypothetical protein